MSFSRAPLYLTWAYETHGKAPFDLATSGALPCLLSELPPLEGALDDPHAPAALAEEIAAYCRVPSREVVSCLGTSHALFLAYAALLDRGDQVLVETPVYEPLVHVAQCLGADVVFFERESSRGYGLDVSNVLRRVTEKTRVVSLSNPHNPTGIRVTDAEVSELATALASRGVTLLVDEVYLPFDAGVAVDGTMPCDSARTLGANVVAVSSLTKCFGAGAHRAGFVLAPPGIADRARAVLVSTLGHLPAAHAAVSLHLLRHRNVLASRALAGIAERRARVGAFMQGRADLSWSAPSSGLFGFARREDRGDDYCARVEKAAASAGVAIVPGRFFRDPKGFRLAWSCSPAALEEGLARLGPALDAC